MNSFDCSTVREIRDQPAIVHCSTVAEAATGDAVCIWYEGAYETSSDTVLRMARLPSDAGAEWQAARTIVDLHGVPLGNPVVWQDPDGPLRLVFSVLLGESWTESLLFETQSTDGGASWNNPSLFQPRRGFMAKTRPISAQGRLVFPLYHETTYCPYVMIIDDTSRPADAALVAETMARGKAIQPVIVPLSDGRLMMLCRTNQGTIWKSVSHNAGFSWTICRPTTLANPDSALDLIRLQGGELLLALNNSRHSRRELQVALSPDDGETWTHCRSVARGDGEYSYPSLVARRDGTVLLSYTEDRYMIRACRFDLDWLLAGPLERPLKTDE
ncbi:MAG: hypothetical protein EA384_09965 [Spirochaetaceae bacterium]|nr:MAG: hypothetical protein EA384_09965 [Spirochaetaceae bacterium]